jgi:hypothetical protein
MPEAQLLVSSCTPNESTTIRLREQLPVRSEDDRILLDQVDRILQSEELRGSGVLRRLLRFLAERTVGPDSEGLKEYSVAIDGLGKPATYDPRHNSAVRIQVGRLRQKLADYYRSEGENDPIIIDIPKGHFRLKFSFRNGSTPKALPLEQEDSTTVSSTTHKGFRRWLMPIRIPIAFIAGVLIALAAGAAYNAIRPTRASAKSRSDSSVWNVEMENLWEPFIATDRPTIVAIEDPLFVELDGKKGIYYRDKTLNNWNDLISSPAVDSLRAALKTGDLAPSRYYTAFGEVDASFLLARVLGARVQNLSVLKTSDFSMRELAENNVVFVGLENLFFTDKIQAAPIEASLLPTREGIRNVHPGPNEPDIFLDQYSTAPAEEGTAYALVTHVPGPMGNNDVESFNCGRAAGYVAAVKAFTDPNSVRALVARLKQAAGGTMPRYYQVLFKVKFKAEEPTEITFVLAKVLHYPARS